MWCLVHDSKSTLALLPLVKLGPSYYHSLKSMKPKAPPITVQITVQITVLINQSALLPLSALYLR
jgi:hypothetical protein